MHKTITRMTGLLVFILLFGASLRLSAQNQEGPKIPLSEAITSVQKRFKTQFAYEHDLLRNKFTTENALQGNSLEEVLKNILYPNNLIFLYVSDNTYSIVARNASFFTGSAAGNNGTATRLRQPAETVTLRGTVTNEKGEPISYASVWVKGTNQATQTNDLGGYLLPAVKAGDVIVFSYVGYKKQEITVGEELKLNVVLTPDGTVLDEVAVVSNGYQQISKERSTGSATVITAKDLEKFPEDNVIQRLEGQIPGLQVNISSGDAGFFYQSGGSIATTQSPNSSTRTVGTNNYSMSIRGNNTLMGETMPLIVLDGAITELDLSTLNPNDIESITFLKDAAAASIWGVRAANGVIVVNTKKGKKSQSPAISFSTNFTMAEKPDLNYYKMMNSSQELAYEKELVDRGLLTATPSSDYYDATYLVTPGAYLAENLQAGNITQAQYNSQASALSAINNSSQVSKYLLQGAQSQQYNLSISGGTDNSTYYYSASYSGERPNEVRNYGKRLTLTMNNSWTILHWATLSTSFKGSFFNLKNDGISLNTLYSPSSSTLMPYELLADGNGKGISYDRLNPGFTSTLPATYQNWQYNYLDELANGDNTQTDNNYNFNVALKVPIVKGLSASATYTNERSYSDQRTFDDQSTYTFRNLVNFYTYPTAATNSLGITDGGILSNINTNQNNYSFRGQLDFDRTFGKSQITALAGTELRETNVGQTTNTLYGYNTETGLTNSNINFSYTPSYQYIAGYSPDDLTTFYYGGYPTQLDKERRFISYFSNAAYTYDNKYVISGSVRYDDYNNFGLDRKYRATPLWSSGFKWNMSQEHFMKDVKWVDHLAIRATYGVNGNLSLSTYPYTWISVGQNYTTGQNDADIIATANPALRWEKTYVKNLGIDFSLFNNRLNGTLDAYYKNSKDLLYSFPISNVYVGTTSTLLTRNAASLENKGIDLGLNGTIYQKGDWNWNAGLTFSYNTNKVTSSQFNPNLYQSYYGQYPTNISYVTGYPTDKLFVYRNAGLDANGLTQIYDHTGKIVSANTTTLSSLSDLKYAGRTTAPFYGGFNTTVHYKQFSLFAQTTYQFGSVFLKPSIQDYITSPYYQTNFDLSADIAKRWEKPGDEATTKVPGLNGSAASIYTSLARYQNSDINVLSADYIRLRQVTFSYQLPTAWLTKIKLKGGQIGATVNNLGLLWKANKDGIDPDFANYVGSTRGLPAARSYTLNLNLNL